MPSKNKAKTPKVKQQKDKQAEAVRKQKSIGSIVGRTVFAPLVFVHLGGIVHFYSPRKKLTKSVNSKHFKLVLDSIQFNGETIVDYKTVEKELYEVTWNHVVELYEEKKDQWDEKKFNENRDREFKRTLKQNVYDEMQNRLIQWFLNHPEYVTIDGDKSKSCNKQTKKAANKKMKMIIIKTQHGNIRIDQDNIAKCGLEWLESQNIETGEGTFTVTSSPEELEQLFRRNATQENITKNFQMNQELTHSISQINALPMIEQNPQQPVVYPNATFMTDFNVNQNANIQTEYYNDIINARNSLHDSQSQQSNGYSDSLNNTILNQSNTQIVTQNPPPVNEEYQFLMEPNDFVQNNQYQNNQEEMNEQQNQFTQNFPDQPIQLPPKIQMMLQHAQQNNTVCNFSNDGNLAYVFDNSTSCYMQYLWVENQQMWNFVQYVVSQQQVISNENGVAHETTNIINY